MKTTKSICRLFLLLLAGSTIHLQAQNPKSDRPAGLPLSFKQYLNQVGQHNLGLLKEKQNISIADAEIIAAKVMPDPELSFSGAKENYSLSLAYTLELGNKRGARVKLAKSEAELARLMLEQFFQELRAEAAEAFLDAIYQRELLNVKRTSYEYMLQLSLSDNYRFHAGEITENDARQSKLEAATLQNEVYAQEANYKSALAILNQYMGQTNELPDLLVAGWSKLERKFTLSELIAIASENRYDLMAALKNNEIAVNKLRLIRAERKIDLGLSAGYERNWHGLFPSRDMMSVGLSVPLKISNANKGQLKTARHVIEQNKYDTAQTQLQIQTEVSRAFYQYEAVIKQVKQYESGLLDEAKAVLEGMVYKYKRGETGIMEVLIAQRSYNEVQEAYLETRKDCASSLVSLEKVCGIWDIDFE